MTSITLVPYLNRDYGSAVAVRLALANGSDFRVADMSSPWDGKPANIHSLRDANIVFVKVRYNKLRSTTVIDLTRNIE
jgi:hypothetical protein